MEKGKQKSGVRVSFAGDSEVAGKIELAVWKKWNKHLISICKKELEK